VRVPMLLSQEIIPLLRAPFEASAETCDVNAAAFAHPCSPRQASMGPALDIARTPLRSPPRNPASDYERLL
jgi:hypothetical protein